MDFADIFLDKLANIFSEQTKVNKYAIKLEKDKQPAYEPIYSLRPVKLKTFKTYIKTDLANGFIWASKLLASALILFIYKLNNRLYLCLNYQGLNDLMIKNRYLLPLIGKLLDWLDQAKQFAQTDLISAYY